MSDPSHSLVAAAQADAQRVLLVTKNERNRQLLREQLTAHEVVVPDSLSSLPAFDLCLVDTAMLKRVADQLSARQADVAPLFLPVLLVVEPSAPERGVRELPACVDEVLEIPTTKRVFDRRVASLLHIRQQSEELSLFRRAMDDAVTGITIADAGGDQEMLYVNEAFVEITGYERSEVLGRNCRFLQGPETDPEPVRKMRRAIDEGESTTVELLNYRKDGTPFWNRVELAPIYGDDGPAYFVGTQQDVTDRVQRERDLSRYEQIVQMAADPIYTLDSDMAFSLVNEATASLVGEPESTLTGQHVASVLGESHAAELADTILEMAETGAVERTIETQIPDAEGQDRTFQTAVALKPGGGFAGVVCVSRDVTAHREREHRLSVLDRVLRHNIRNKLHVVLAQVDFIDDDNVDETLAERTAAIENAAEELLDLANTARQFHETLDPDSADAVEALDIAAHAGHVVEEASIEHGDATVVLHAPDTAPALALDAFELGLTEVVENAIEYGPPDVTVELDVGVEEDTVVVTVTDDGHGMPEPEREALSAGMESDLQHSTGLGLWFVRWMVTNSGGEFDIRDNEPTGTVVELRFQRADSAETTQ